MQTVYLSPEDNTTERSVKLAIDHVFQASVLIGNLSVQETSFEDTFSKLEGRLAELLNDLQDITFSQGE